MLEMKDYVKKSQSVNAVQFTIGNLISGKDVAFWERFGKVVLYKDWGDQWIGFKAEAYDGEILVENGDWIVEDNGVIHVYSDDMFRKLYELKP